MFPRYSFYNRRDRLSRDAVFNGDVAMGSSQHSVSDNWNVGIQESGILVSLSSDMISPKLSKRMSKVFGGTNIFKIFYSIIVLVPVFMVYLQLRRVWPQEGQGHKTMNGATKLFAVSTKLYAQISGTDDGAIAHTPNVMDAAKRVRCNPPYPTYVRDLIDFFEPRCWAPFNHVNSPFRIRET